MSEENKECISVATLNFRLKNQPSGKLFKFLEELYWSEQIYEPADFAPLFNCEFKVLLTVLSPSNLSEDVWKLINKEVAEENSEA